MAVAQNGICYMGAFEKTTGQSNTYVNPPISDTLPVRVNTGIIQKKPTVVILKLSCAARKFKNNNSK
jgi:hypothetical protein